MPFRWLRVQDGEAVGSSRLHSELSSSLGLEMMLDVDVFQTLTANSASFTLATAQVRAM